MATDSPDTGLVLDPDQAGHWIQAGQLALAQGNAVDAECALRSACALGAAPDAVTALIHDAMARQAVAESDFPIRFRDPAASGLRQLPTRSDAESLLRTLWGPDSFTAADVLALLRGSTSLESALALAAADARALGQRLAPAPEMGALVDTVQALRGEVRAIRQLVGPFAASFPNGDILTQTIHGVKYFVDPDDLIITPQMIIYRQWEADLSYLFRVLCKPDTVLVDVGANFGYFTCLAGTLMGNGGHGVIHAFEPNPKLAALARRNIEINWSMAPITLHEVAVADSAGEVTLHIPFAHGANASLTAGDAGHGDNVVVHAVRLDDVLPADLAVDVMKVDVEGHELGVLRGARAVIARSPDITVIMEWSRQQMADAGVDPQDILDLFAGFNVYRSELGSDPFAHREDHAWLMQQAYVDVLFSRR